MAQVWKEEKLCLCRCCHSEGQAYTSLDTKCFWMGEEEEAYDKILQDCFDIQLEPVPDLIRELLSTICEKCIERLRDATIFKHQVKKCERMFKKIYTGQFGNDEATTATDKHLKIEPTEDSDDEVIRTAIETIPDVQVVETNDNNDAFNDDDRFSDDDYIQGFDDKPKPRKRAKTTKKTTKKVTKKRKSKKNTEDTSEEKNEEGGEEAATSTSGNKRPIMQVREDTDYRRVVRQSSVVLQCCSCDKEWELKHLELLKSHIRYVHMKIPRYYCKYCDKSFALQGPYTVHKLKEHNVDDRYKCTACDKTYYCRRYLTSHYNSFHMLGERHKCDVCEFETYLQSRLKRHKDKHKTEKDYHCSYCNKSFVRKTTLQFHERIHTGDKRKVCKVCAQAFVQKASLNYHMAKHHPGVDF